MTGPPRTISSSQTAAVSAATDGHVADMTALLETWQATLKLTPEQAKLVALLSKRVAFDRAVGERRAASKIARDLARAELGAASDTDGDAATCCPTCGRRGEG